MIKITLVSSFRPSRFVLWCLIASCHLLMIVFLSRTNQWTNAKFLNSVMTIVPINRLPPPDPASLAYHGEDKKRLKLQESKTSIIKPTKKVDTNVSEQVSVENGSKNELASDSLSGAVSDKDFTTLGSIANRYKLQVPKSAVEETLTPAQQAAQDVRSNSAKLTKSEKFAVAMGTLDCIFQARLPDGKVIREPGKWVVLPARSDGSLKPLAKARFCVRFHQAEDENGNDLTAISSGIKGKL
jgi:hypothetical protein